MDADSVFQPGSIHIIVVLKREIYKTSGWVPYFTFSKWINEHWEMKLRLREQYWIVLLERRLGVIDQEKAR